MSKITQLITFALTNKRQIIDQCYDIIKSNYCKETADLFAKEVAEYTDKWFFGKLIYPMRFYVITRYKEVVAIGAWNTSMTDDSNFEIYWVNTKKKYANRGYGTQIVNRLIDDIKKENYNHSEIILSSRNKNISFYEKFGFRVVSKNRIKSLMIKSI